MIRFAAFRFPPSRLVALGLLATGLTVFAQGTWLGVKADIAQVLLAQAWTRAIDGESASTPWPWADFRPVARLSVPSLGEHAIVLSDGGGEALAFGPALLYAAARPGEAGVSVIAAHRDTHFAFLERLTPGDIVIVERAEGAPLHYRVTTTEVVDAARSGIEPAIGPSRLALVTCWPFGSLLPGPDRYVVWAEPVTTL
ncbi:class GN sortase [Maricaulis sp.]|uniref:class GN sortase n=1 Tax=Maricaulis sp. TaxID=1486257 RepID=UPI002B2757FC|nr:class GN sortase [Maricaulis sp.]